MVYDSYGVMSTDSGSVQADYVSYTAREAERDLGIYYYRARFYDPLTGRFMVRDPLGLSAGDVNLYRYVGNNPVSLRDPFGLWSVTIAYAWGYGAALTFGSHGGTHFVNLTAAVGAGGAFNINPFGEPPSYLKLNPCVGESGAFGVGVGYEIGAGIGGFGLAEIGVTHAGYWLVGAVITDGQYIGLGGPINHRIFGSNPILRDFETIPYLGFGPFNRRWGFSLYGVAGFRGGFSWR